MRRLLTALQFLTIIPVCQKSPVTGADIVKSSSLFVPVGLIQGFLLIAVYGAAGRVFQQELIAGLVLLALVLTHGGFHLDGLADTFDALAARGNREKKLSVMRDGAIGPAGAVAVFFALLLKFLALKNLPSLFLCSSLILLPAFSKWAMVISMFYGRPARRDGLGRIFLNSIGRKELLLSTFMLILSCVTLQAFLDRSSPYTRYFFYAIPAIFVYLLSRLSIYALSGHFGGLTGDTLGAISEISETGFLFAVIAWSRLYT